MLRLGTSPPDTREMDLDDIYLLRLKLRRGFPEAVMKFI
jgi:hypothetical protein